MSHLASEPSLLHVKRVRQSSLILLHVTGRRWTLFDVEATCAAAIASCDQHSEHNTWSVSTKHPSLTLSAIRKCNLPDTSSCIVCDLSDYFRICLKIIPIYHIFLKSVVDIVAFQLLCINTLDVFKVVPMSIYFYIPKFSNDLPSCAAFKLSRYCVASLSRF